MQINKDFEHSTHSCVRLCARFNCLIDGSNFIGSQFDEPAMDFISILNHISRQAIVQLTILDTIDETQRKHFVK